MIACVGSLLSSFFEVVPGSLAWTSHGPAYGPRLWERPLSVMMLMMIGNNETEVIWVLIIYVLSLSF
jgi:hypothetical protein